MGVSKVWWRRGLSTKCCKNRAVEGMQMANGLPRGLREGQTREEDVRSDRQASPDPESRWQALRETLPLGPSSRWRMTATIVFTSQTPKSSSVASVSSPKSVGREVTNPSVRVPGGSA